MDLLVTEKMNISFGGVVALKDVSFRVQNEEIVGLIGPNGAGKTTVLNCICRYYNLKSGNILFRGKSLVRSRPNQLVGQGISRTFQHLELFSSMTTVDNLIVAQLSSGQWLEQEETRSLLRWPWHAKKQAQQRARRFLREFELIEFEDWPAAALSFGHRRKLDIARALIVNPKVILLDEPASGSTHVEVQGLKETLLRIRKDHGSAILLVEHNVPMVMEVSDRIVVLNFGEKLAEGTPQEIKQSDVVVNAYLGAK